MLLLRKIVSFGLNGAGCHPIKGISLACNMT